MTQYLSQLMLAKLFAVSLLLGLLLGAVYDLFRIRRAAFRKFNVLGWLARRLPHPKKPKKQKKRRAAKYNAKKAKASAPTAEKPQTDRKTVAPWLTHLEDLLFGVLAGVSTAILYFALSMGQVRLMAIIGEGIGFLLYRQTLGRLVMACTDGILCGLAWIFGQIVRWLIRPPIRLVRRIMRALAGALRRKSEKLRQKRLQRAGQRAAALYAERLSALAAVGFDQTAVKKALRQEGKKRPKKRQKQAN